MRILFFSDHFKPEPSAPAAHVYERAKKWVEWGYDVTVICAAPNFPEGEVYEGYRNVWRSIEYMEGIRVVRVKTYITPNEGTVRRILDYVSYTISSLMNSLFEPRPDVIISTSPHLFVPVGGVLSATLRRVPHVFEIRDLWPATISAVTGLGRGRLYGLLERLELWLYRRSRKIIAFTPYFERDLIERGIDGGKIEVVINGANMEIFSPNAIRDASLVEELELEGRFVVTFLGTIGLSQGLENAIEAAELLQGDNVHFLFVGVGAAKATLVEMTEDKGLENVTFLPRQTKESMPRYWSLSDASLIHLTNDPVFATVIPSKIFESMACGKAIIYVGPAGEGSRIVEEHDAGVVVDNADSPDRLAQAIRHLQTDDEERQRLAANSRAAAPLYSRERQAENTLKVLVAAAGGAADKGEAEA